MSIESSKQGGAAGGATSRPLEECQICGSGALESVLFVGYIPPVNTMQVVGSVPVEQVAYPLGLLRCTECTAVQIGLEVDADILFPPEYPYLSGTTRILRENFAELYREASARLELGPDDLVIDIGSNDGTLLSNFHEGGHRVLGVEPSQAGERAIERGIDTRITFFGREVAAEIRAAEGPARIVTAANVFAHIGDVHAVVEGIVALLGARGVFISESHYLLSLVETLQYDTIYHEHLRYYTLRSLVRLLGEHGLEVFDAKRIPTHGGSIRVWAARKGEYAVQPTVAAILAEEDEAGITDGSALRTFRERVLRSKLRLHELLRPLKEAGARIYGVGAPSRASTLVNYTGLDDGIVDAVMEVAASPKVGKYIPGTRIPVLDETKLFEDQPEYALLFSWHISEELVRNLRRKGFRGRFITPLPEPRLLDD